MTLWAWLVSHDAIAAALLGTILGAVLSFALSYFTDLLQRKRRQRVVSMRIATDLRQWMNRLWSRISDTRTSIASDGAGGTPYTEVPDLRFEGDLNQIPLLDSGTAKRIFELIHKKDAVNAEAEGTLEYQDHDEALDVFLGRAANLFLTAVAIYDDISRQVGWDERPFSQAKETMQAEVDRLSEIEAKRAAFNQKFFADV
jgi:hypothetical protein